MLRGSNRPESRAVLGVLGLALLFYVVNNGVWLLLDRSSPSYDKAAHAGFALQFLRLCEAPTRLSLAKAAEGHAVLAAVLPHRQRARHDGPRLLRVERRGGVKPQNSAVWYPASVGTSRGPTSPGSATSRVHRGLVIGRRGSAAAGRATNVAVQAMAAT